MKKMPAQPVQGLIDGVRVLRELASVSGPVSCKSLSETLGLEATRVNRILKTFDHLGMAHRTRDRKYRAGSAIQVLAIQSLVGSGLLSRVLPVLEELRRPGLVTALGVLWRDTVTYLYHANPGVSHVDSIGSLQLIPATQSSIGMLLLSGYSDEEIRDLYRDRTIPDFSSVSDLVTSLGRIREQGFACLSNEARKSVAVGVGDPPWAAIAVSGKMDEHDVSPHVERFRVASRKITEQENKV